MTAPEPLPEEAVTDARVDCILKAYEDGSMDAAGTIEDLVEVIAMRAATQPAALPEEEVMRRLAYSVANAKLGEGPGVRCEGPTDYEIGQAREWVRRVIQAQLSTPLPPRCSACGGSGYDLADVRKYGDLQKPCSVCKGSGRLPPKPKVEDAG